jgi:hypothetical protein
MIAFPHTDELLRLLRIVFPHIGIKVALKAFPHTNIHSRLIMIAFPQTHRQTETDRKKHSKSCLR